MLLPLEDVEQFYQLHRSLVFFVNRRLEVIPKIATIDTYSGLAPESRIKVHQALLEHIDLIDAFAAENPFGYDEPDLEIIRSWKNLIAGTFYAFRQLQDYMVLLSSTAPVVAYGVVALSDPFEVVIGPDLPRMIETILLPFIKFSFFDAKTIPYKWIIFLGENGSGKTFVLRSLAILLAGPEGAEKPLPRPLDWVRHETKPGVLSAQLNQGAGDPGVYKGGTTKFRNPCKDDPSDHFAFQYDWIAKLVTVRPLTARGRVTESILGLNRKELRKDRSRQIKKLVALSPCAATNAEAREELQKSRKPDSEYSAFAKSLIILL